MAVAVVLTACASSTKIVNQWVSPDVSETSLCDAARNQLVWTGTAETTAPGDINKEIEGYVNTVIKSKNILAS